MNETKILLIIGSNPATIAFTNNFISKYKPAAIIQQSGGPEGDKFVDILDLKLKPDSNFTDKDMPEHILEEVYENIFIDNPKTIQHFKIPKGQLNKNNNLILNIKRINPDIIISHGPEKIGMEIINLSKFGGINIHWGLSPKYKGSHTARWALLHGKPEWIGLTVHMLDDNYDTGPILYQSRPDLKRHWSIKHIEYSLTRLAFDIIPIAMEKIIKGEKYQINQNLDEGKFYHSREYNTENKKKLTQKYITELIDRYLNDKNKYDEGVTLINEWK